MGGAIGSSGAAAAGLVTSSELAGAEGASDKVAGSGGEGEGIGEGGSVEGRKGGDDGRGDEAEDADRRLVASLHTRLQQMTLTHEVRGEWPWINASAGMRSRGVQ